MEAAAALAVSLALGVAGLAVLAPATTLESAETHHVHIQGFSMDPLELTVAPGDTVVWHNHDGASHTATDDGDTWGTGVLSSGDSASITFETEASYTYHCEVHPTTMTGFVLEVVAPNDPPTVAIDQPSEGDVVTGEVAVSGTASDPDGTVQRVDVRIDGGPWQAASGTTDWSYAWDTTQLPDGEHEIETRSYDGAVSSEIAAVNVTAENPNPDLTLQALSTDQQTTIAVLTATVTNQGELEAPPSSVRFSYLPGGSQAEPTTIGSVDLPVLAPGATAEATVIWDTKGKVGRFVVDATADPDGALLEGSETNNRAEETVCVPSVEGLTCALPGQDPLGQG